MKMTLDGTQKVTQVPGRSTWSDLTTIMRDMRAPVSGGGDISVA